LGIIQYSSKIYRSTIGDYRVIPDNQTMAKTVARPKGRPKKAKSEEIYPNRFTVPMSDLMLSELKQRAGSEDRSPSWIVRKAIAEYLSKPATPGAQTTAKSVETEPKKLKDFSE
jgi:hypothetical protein